MEIYLENQSENLKTDAKTLKDLFFSKDWGKEKKFIAVAVNGKLADWERPIQNGEKVQFLSFEEKMGKECFWHSSAHILAQAIARHYPAAKPTIGPPIDEGFYYDFFDLTFSEKDFEKIEQEMEKIRKENFSILKEEIPSAKAAQETFSHNPFKLELIEEFKTNLSLYRQGEFFDLCRGPHVQKTGKIGPIKILKTAGAYWRGDVKKPQLTRIYAISFPSKEEMNAYLQRMAEAQKRDHRILGSKLQLFSFEKEAPGMPFILPKGMAIWQELVGYWRKLKLENHYQEIQTPQMMKKELWEVSGHWANYQENMYLSHVDEEDYAIKPMNCPGACLFYKTTKHSYRDLPLRTFEVGHVHRHELSGALSGMFRVRSFHQDDSHLFVKPEDIANEVEKIIQLSEKIYSTFGLKYHFELSTKPENAIGSDAIWESSTEDLKNVLTKLEHKFKINEGDGAFYGPKIDVHVQDAIGRFWQCGTIQLDMNLPARFGLKYTAAENQEMQPVMLHNAIYGSIERFFGILIEHFSGKFPLWLSPEQVRILPITEHQAIYAKKIWENLAQKGIRAQWDGTNESLNKKIRNAQNDQVNYMVILGEKEAESGFLSLRSRSGKNFDQISLEKLIATCQEETETKSLHPLFL